MTLSELKELLKDPKIWLIIVLLVLAFVIVAYILFKPKPIPEWRGITPSKTTKSEVLNLLGNPVKTQTDTNIEILGYGSDFGKRLHEVWIENNKVVLIKEQLGVNDKRSLSDFKKSGDPEILYSAQFATGQALYAFAGSGYAVLANSMTGKINEIWYFEPNSSTGFLNKFGSGLSQTQPNPSY